MLPTIEEDPGRLRLTSVADGVILVVEARRTRWEVAQQGTETIDQARANILGVILNKREYPITEWLYRKI